MSFLYPCHLKNESVPLSNAGCLHCRRLTRQDFQGQDWWSTWFSGLRKGQHEVTNLDKLKSTKSNMQYGEKCIMETIFVWPTSGAALWSSSYDLSVAVLKVESRAMSKNIRSFMRSGESRSKGRSSTRASNNPYKVAFC